ncbi:MAG: M20/M25/M40 family metallo-hydrolase [Eubacterium sp.]|nr:M20/M25/M40 family metallo-hydrolase [Eubacterium sp.]
MNTVELLEKLTSAVGVSGAENEIGKTVAGLLSQYGKVYTDSMNNVYCTFGEGAHFLLDAHIDEIGFIVKAVSDGGFLKVDRCGGIDCRMLLGSEVCVHGKKELRGVISTLPPHLQKDGDSKKVPGLDEIAIDIGLDKKEAEELVSSGDRVTFKRNFNKLLNNQLSASVLDDRSGAAAVILAIDMLKDVNAKITVMLSSQEEVGCRGASVGVFDKKVDEAIAVDVTFGYSPLCKKSECCELGKGPAIGFSPVLNAEMSKKLVAVAEMNGIPYQREVMGGGHTGTNADVISVNESGVRTALLSIPEKYMHSPIEIIDTSDVENTARLITEYIKERAGELNA